MTGNEVVQRSPAQELVAQVRAPVFIEQVEMVLPDNVPARRFVRATATALLANPDLANLETDSVLRALLRAAQDGLMPDGHEAALVPFKGKAQYVPMIGGYRRIAGEHGWSIETRVVYQADEFEHEAGLDERLVHRPAPTTVDRGEMVAVYAIGRHRDGRRMFEVLRPDEVAKLRKVSKYGDRGPWVEWTERMWEKSAGKLLFKRLPLDPNDARVRRVIEADELEHGQAAARLYGEVPARPAIPATTTPAQGTPADAATEASGGSQATGGQGDEPAAAGAPSDETAEGAPEPTVETEAAGEPAAAGPTLEQARAFAFESGPNAGKTLGQVAAADGALTWFGWALNNLANMPDDVAAAVRLVAEHDVPDAWSAHTKGA